MTAGRVQCIHTIGRGAATLQERRSWEMDKDTLGEEWGDEVNHAKGRQQCLI
jgi:hypothetical protein